VNCLALGALLWYVFSELFVGSSPNKVYADALKKVKLNEEVQAATFVPCCKLISRAVLHSSISVVLGYGCSGRANQSLR
jgi:hypothetical protein